MTSAGYKDGQWYDVGFWRLNLNNPTEIMAPINLIDEVKGTSTFTKTVTYGEQFLKLS